MSGASFICIIPVGVEAMWQGVAFKCQAWVAAGTGSQVHQSRRGEATRRPVGQSARFDTLALMIKKPFDLKTHFHP